ncbi:hypothetical protein QTP88_016568 [Uroleucon formosanum]
MSTCPNENEGYTFSDYILKSYIESGCLFPPELWASEPSISPREAVPPNIKLLITLRYLATGDSFSSLMYLFRVSKQYISAMLPVVIKAIVKALKKYIKVRG